MASTASKYCGNISGSIIGVKITPQIEIQADINIAKIFNFLLDFRFASSGNKNLKITFGKIVRPITTCNARE